MELRLKDIKKFYGVSSDTTAVSRVKEVKCFLNKEHKKRITDYDLAQYEKMDIKIVRSILQLPF